MGDAVIQQAGLCVWRSGPRPDLELKTDGALLRGRMALWWSGQSHSTPDLADSPRDYDAIAQAGQLARDAVWNQDYETLAEAVRKSYSVQRAEGMSPLPAAPDAEPHEKLAACNPLAFKYCGGGFGGYAVYLFADRAGRDAACELEGFRSIEPYLTPAASEAGGATE